MASNVQYPHHGSPITPKEKCRSENAPSLRRPRIPGPTRFHPLGSPVRRAHTRIELRAGRRPPAGRGRRARRAGAPAAPVSLRGPRGGRVRRGLRGVRRGRGHHRLGPLPRGRHRADRLPRRAAAGGPGCEPARSVVHQRPQPQAGHGPRGVHLAAHLPAPDRAPLARRRAGREAPALHRDRRGQHGLRRDRQQRLGRVDGGPRPRPPARTLLRAADDLPERGGHAGLAHRRGGPRSDGAARLHRTRPLRADRGRLPRRPRQHEPAATREDGSAGWRSLRTALGDVRARPFLYYQLAWNGAVGISASFFAYHLLTNLRTGFLVVAAHGVGVAIVRIASARLWGRAVDRIGARPVLICCSFGISVVPAIWLLTSPDRLWPIAMEAVVSGFLWGGHGIAALDLTIGL